MAFVKAAKVGDIPPGRVKVVEVGDEDVALCNVNGEFYALANVCTHDDGPLVEGEVVDAGEVECPRHGARFDIRTGRATRMPAFEPVPTYEVRVEGNDVLVESPV